MNQSSDYAWMRAALRSLFDHASDDAVRKAIRSPDALTALRADLERRLPAEESAHIPAGELGDNLLMALLALRAKFSRDEAMAKVEMNIAMRASRGVRT